MRDQYLPSVSPLFQPAVYYFSQFVPNASHHSSDFAPNNEKSKNHEHAGRTALVVDDVADVTEMLAVVLTHAGYNVVTAASAPAALKAASERQFDVIISDIGMPEENGYDFIKRVRSLDPHQGGRIPAVSVTAYTTPKDVARAIAAGYQMHVPKPMDPAALVKAVAKLAPRDR